MVSRYDNLESNIHVELSNGWKVLLLKLRDGVLRGYSKVSKGKGNFTLEEVLTMTLTKKSLIVSTNIRPAVQAKLQSAGVLPDDPYFFKVQTPAEGKVIMCCDGLDLRKSWINGIKEAINQQVADIARSQMTMNPMNVNKGADMTDGRDQYYLTEEEKEERLAAPRAITRYSLTAAKIALYVEGINNGQEPTDLGEKSLSSRIVSRVDSVLRLSNILLSFPFVLVVSTMTLSERFSFLRSVMVIRIMNLSIYALAPFIVEIVLSKTNQFWQRVAIGSYCALYLAPVIAVIMHKITVQRNKDVVDGATFNFKPAKNMRWTFANVFLISGFMTDWIQHVMYTLPLGINFLGFFGLDSMEEEGSEEKREGPTTLEDMLPFGLTFHFYFYVSFFSILFCALILILNAALKGKAQYAINRNWILWLIYFDIGGAYFVGIVTIMFMGLWCDYDNPKYGSNDPRLFQSEDIKCWATGTENADGTSADVFYAHGTMATCAMLGLAFFLIQMTLLPSGTFKETMTDQGLDLVFVPVYLQMHMLLKAVFSGVYVVFYSENMPRAATLTIINLFQFVLNHSMQPCSIPLVNTWRDITYLTALLSGVQSLNYIAFDHINEDIRELYISTLVTNVFLCTVGVLLYHYNTQRSSEYIIARALLDLEWQVTRGLNVVNPRVLEPLIALTLSDVEDDRKVAIDHIDQMVWLIGYPKVRVQFQSIWALANVSIFSEEARMKCHQAGCTSTLFELWGTMDFMVEMETLATLANLTLSPAVTRYMIKHHDAISFFLDLARGSKVRHADFATVALGNICRHPEWTDKVIAAGGIQVVVGAFISNDYGKQRSSCRALANICLSRSSLVQEALSSKILLDRIVTFAERNELETQLEVSQLLRALFCRPEIRSILMGMHVYDVVLYFAKSSIPDVRLHSDDMYRMMEVDIGLEVRQPDETDDDYLRQLRPLDGMISWNSWGSKLDSIFSPIFSSVPTLSGHSYTLMQGTSQQVDMMNGINKERRDGLRDSITFIIVDDPMHGSLEEKEGSSVVRYTPDYDFKGNDYFVYTIQVGGLTSPPSTVSLVVTEDPNYKPRAVLKSHLDMDASEGDGSMTMRAGPTRRKRTIASDDVEEGGSVGKDDESVHSQNLKGVAMANLRVTAGGDTSDYDFRSPSAFVGTMSSLNSNMSRNRGSKRTNDK